MQQHSRGNRPPMSPATSPRSIPPRANNQRDRPRDEDSSETFPYTERPSGESVAGNTGQPVERTARDAEKARQVTQNFFKRAALIIASSRVNLPPEFIPDSTQIRSTKWFQMIFDESEELSEELADWTMVDVVSERPPPLIIEIYLDTSELTRNQTLVVLDERRGKWDVCDALSVPGASTQGRSRQARRTRVVLERWKISLGDAPPSQSSASSEPMPNIYKKAIILFRSLYTYCRFLPTWKFGRRIAQQPATLNTLRPMYRILDEEPRRAPKDPLTTPLYPTAEPTVQTYKFPPLKSPVGSYNIQVSYRVNCDFRVDDSEALLSSHFMGIDDEFAPHSAGNTSGHAIRLHAGANDAGSLPADRRWLNNRSDVTQAYGSLSTFHHQGPGTGTSPISALRAARDLATESQGESPPQKPPPNQRTSQGSKSSLRSDAVGLAQRRVSVSFQPFKHGSLSSSPATGIVVPQSPGSLAGARLSDVGQGLLQPRNRTSLTALPQTALRAPPIPGPEVAVGSPSSGSPKAPPIGKYSSSFGHRRSRFSSGGGGSGKTDDDNNSSGKGSQTSLQPGSGVLGDAEGGSSGSAHTDDDNISDFLKLLEQKKDLKSFNRTDDASRDASTRRTSAALSKFRGMRDSNIALGDSLSSSMMMQRSSSSSSRQLSSVPPMLAGASVSTSSSPSKPISPHTPHTPAIPSRLSEHATIRRENSGTRVQQPSAQLESTSSSSNDDSSNSTTRNRPSGAIPIPTSPMRHPHIRRSSSAHQRHRAGHQGLEEYDLRPASLPGLDDRPEPELSLSELLHTQHPPGQTAAGDGSNTGGHSTAAVPGTSLESHDDDRPSPSSVGDGTSTARRSAKSRLLRRGSGSTASLGRGSGYSDRAGRFSFSNRLAATTPVDDEEPLLFTMSELGRQSVEDVRSSTGPSTTQPGRGATELGGGSGRTGKHKASGAGSVW